MQESVTIPISLLFINAVARDTPVAAIIYAELHNHIRPIADMLTGYHWAERGAVQDVIIEPGSVSIDAAGQGSFMVKYNTNIHYGCSDKDIDLINSMRIGIKADLNKGIAILTGENIVEREPDSF